MNKSILIAFIQHLGVFRYSKNAIFPFSSFKKGATIGRLIATSVVVFF
ncbi:hypothetical protein [Tunicatimonas pelagia]|nr:hypothetical protein [Tunicatimonas pelagia]WKN46313.1 hypothetical protein P0M28_15295 [Tunicatimonas pelagia]